ncbi:MAG: response regulator transcription factor [Halanaerobiales bacterium]
MDLYNKKILVIEDDEHVFAVIEAMFKPYEDNILVLKQDGERGLEEALNNDYDLVLLDIMLPKKDGWEVCKELKEKKNNLPIIMLTAKSEETDKVLGLEIGADDYVTKPFSPRELIARIKAVLRRFEKTTDGNNEVINFENLKMKIDIGKYLVYVNNQKLSLTPKEFKLLAYLARNEEQVFTREQLLENIWGFKNLSETRTIDEHIKRIRKKLSAADIIYQPIKTVWGVGYKFSSRKEKNNDS